MSNRKQKNILEHCGRGLGTVLSLVVEKGGGRREWRRRKKGLVFEGLGLLPGEEVTPKVT